MEQPVAKEAPTHLSTASKRKTHGMIVLKDLGWRLAKKRIYDTIIIGFPVWWYTAPTIINTFIEENNINSKDMYVFVTSGGSGVNDSFNNLKNAYPENNWKKGIRLRGNESESILKEWLDE